jgi:hypothetical protein
VSAPRSRARSGSTNRASEIDDELVQMILAHHVLVCPTLFVTTGYPLALSNQWQATPDEQRLADPQILATMHDPQGRVRPARASPCCAARHPVGASANIIAFTGTDHGRTAFIPRLG